MLCAGLFLCSVCRPFFPPQSFPPCFQFVFIPLAVPVSFFILSFPPCIMRSVMSELSPWRGCWLFSYLPLSSRASRVAQTSTGPVCALILIGLCVRFYLRVHTCLQSVWDVQLSGSATGGECWSVSLWAPSLSPPSQDGRLSSRTSLSLTCFSFFPSVWLHRPGQRPTGTPFKFCFSILFRFQRLVGV